MIVFLTMISLNSSHVTNSLTTKVDCLQFSHNGALLMASSSESKGIPYDLHFETVLTRKYIFRRCQNDRNCDKWSSSALAHEQHAFTLCVLNRFSPQKHTPRPWECTWSSTSIQPFTTKCEHPTKETSRELASRRSNWKHEPVWHVWVSVMISGVCITKLQVQKVHMVDSLLDFSEWLGLRKIQRTQNRGPACQTPAFSLTISFSGRSVSWIFLTTTWQRYRESGKPQYRFESESSRWSGWALPQQGT